jgi:hypothetical protein
MQIVTDSDRWMIFLNSDLGVTILLNFAWKGKKVLLGFKKISFAVKNAENSVIFFLSDVKQTQYFNVI